ncbi:hypothetical protein PFISCL1PPCAC_29151 [Pristionchus fissidentatus]|uniref:Uncharacterized protein n=1 Tax=Pristionchus fissidentatus TaxID=1538716 RepID=A0AAV5X5D6_9BILA|nr:hypothetical protein PFISCL1PPCAC_3727 [Pristionchus fissidentatus]GMT37854.1 hypothetical protein PFISCL1PPCAC_29151 [Pristionchus fissidentatus]
MRVVSPCLPLYSPSGWTSSRIGVSTVLLSSFDGALHTSSWGRLSRLEDDTVLLLLSPSLFAVLSTPPETVMQGTVLCVNHCFPSHFHSLFRVEECRGEPYKFQSRLLLVSPLLQLDRGHRSSRDIVRIQHEGYIYWRMFRAHQ